MARRVEGDGESAWRSASAPAAATLVVVACTALLRFQSTPEIPRGSDFGAGAAARPYLALVVAQPADCESGTRHLGALNAAAVRESVQVGALVIGTGAELARATEVLRDRFGPVPVRPATRRQLAALRAVGLRATPFVAVIDRGGRIVFTTPAPRDAAGADRLRRTLELVTEAHTPEDADATRA